MGNGRHICTSTFSQVKTDRSFDAEYYVFSFAISVSRSMPIPMGWGQQKWRRNKKMKFGQRLIYGLSRLRNPIFKVIVQIQPPGVRPKGVETKYWLFLRNSILLYRSLKSLNLILSVIFGSELSSATIESL